MITRYEEEDLRVMCNTFFPTGVKLARYLSGRYDEAIQTKGVVSVTMRERFDRWVDLYDMTKWKAANIYGDISYRRSERERVDHLVRTRNAPVEPASVSEDFMDSATDLESMALVDETSENLLSTAYAGYLLKEG